MLYSQEETTLNVTITPAKLSGAVTPPPSKSQAHRFLIAAALAEGESVIHDLVMSEDIQATLDFMYWCVTSETGLEYLCSGDHMGFVIPFKGNLESSNLLVNIANEYVANGTTSIKWCFPTMPSEEWKNVLGSALTAYAADQTDANWETVRAAFVDNWAAEKSK